MESVSANASASGQLKKTAMFLRDTLMSIGYAADCFDGYGPAPIVWARRGPVGGKISLIMYGHYDVQPADPLELWHSSPFELSAVDGMLRGRGVADDKGPIVAVLAALQDIGDPGDVRINVLFEGAEEIGSVGFEDFLRDHGDKIRSHGALVVDAGCPDCQTPALVTGLRGLISFELSLRTARGDIHSGYGGATPNAIHELLSLCGKLHYEDGSAAIPRFYGDVQPPGPGEIEAFQLLDGRRNLADDLGVPLQRKIFAKIPASATHGLMPSLEFNGIWGGYCGDGCKTIIPAEAFAKFTVRTVPNQRSEAICDAVEAFIGKNCPSHVQFKLQRSIGGDAYAIDWPSADKKFVAMFLAMESALASEFENAPLRLREGGSIGVVGTFKKILATDSILLGVVPTSSNIHAPNENWSIGSFQRTRRSVEKFVRTIGNSPNN